VIDNKFELVIVYPLTIENLNLSKTLALENIAASSIIKFAEKSRQRRIKLVNKGSS